ncbi:MAG: hypothetical protein H0T15_05410 [Thermoleophilaceae bacterium]|nr:hypothetical protein [Thermoleophilaceae bacterium]
MRAGACTAAVLVALGFTGCAGEERAEDTILPKTALTPPAPKANEATFESPELRMTAFLESRGREGEVGSRTVDAERGRVVVVRLELANRGSVPIEASDFDVALRTSNGGEVRPTATNSDSSAVFDRRPVPGGGRVEAVAGFELPARAVPGAKLVISDPLRDLRFDLSLGLDG